MKYTPEEWIKARDMIESRNDFPAPYNCAIAVCADLINRISELERLLQEHQSRPVYPTKPMGGD